MCLRYAANGWVDIYTRSSERYASLERAYVLSPAMQAINCAAYISLSAGGAMSL